MLLGRPRFARMAAVAAAGVSCLAAVACGSSTTSSGGIVFASLRPVPRISGAVDPLAGLPASKIAARAIANAEAAQTLTVTGTATNSGTSSALTLGFKRGVGCAGTADVCSLPKMLNSGRSVSYTKEAVTTYRGARVLPLKLSDGSTEYVTDTSKPEFVRAYAPEGSQVGPCNLAISVGAPVTLTAPPASQVLKESALGISPEPAQPASTTGPSLT